MKTKCTQCKTAVDSKDKKCSNCGADLTKQRKNGCIFGAGVIVLIITIMAIVLYGGDDDPEIEHNSKVSYTQKDAVENSYQFVKKLLKSPSSAEFPDDESVVINVNDTTFFVSNAVDSQNSFGAMIRTRYTCTIVFLPNNQVKCLELELKE